MPAVPDAHDRRPAVRPRRRALRRLGGDGASTPSPTTARSGATPVEPVRRPARHRRQRPDAADAPRAARCAARPAAPAGEPGRASTARSCASNPDTGAAHAATTRAPATRTPTAAGSSPTASATRSASPSAPARARSGSATSAGTRGGDRPRPGRRHRPQLRLALLRGRRPSGRLRRARRQHLRDALRARRTPYAAVLHLQPRHAVRGDGCPPGTSSITGIAFYTGAQFPGSLPQRAVLRRLRARAASGRCRAGANGLPDPRPRQRRSSRPPSGRSTSSRGPTAPSTTPTSRAATIRHIAFPGGNHRRPRAPPRRQTTARRR